MEIKGENPFPNRLSFLSQCSSRSPTIRCWRCGDGVLLILTGSKCERVLGSQEIRRTAEWGNYSVLGVVFSFVLTTATCGSGNLHPHEYIFRPQLNPWRNASCCSPSWRFSCRRPMRRATLTTFKRRGASPGRAIEEHSNNNNQTPLLGPTTVLDLEVATLYLGAATLLYLGQQQCFWEQQHSHIWEQQCHT